MAEPAPDQPGAPIAKDAIDPELIKLRRNRPKFGVVTAAGIVFLSVLFLLRIEPDRRFSGSSTQPQHASVADVVAGNVATERLVSVDTEAEPLMAQALRAYTTKGTPGLRVVPVRRSDSKLWIVQSGDGWDPPQLQGYTGRLRKISDLPFAAAARAYATAHPQPVFATATAVRAGIASGQIATVSGETVTPGPTDRIAFEIVDPSEALVVATIGDKLPTLDAWTKALADAGITTHGTPQATTDLIRFEATGDVATLTDKLNKAQLVAARVEPMTRHFETTWSELRTSPPTGLTAHGQVIPEAQLELVGLYVPRGIPDGAYALITGEHPEDYWYVLPVAVAVSLIALLFAWALVRAVKRELLPTAPPAA